MTNEQVNSLLIFIIATVRYEVAHHCEKNKAFQEQIQAQATLMKVLADPTSDEHGG